MNLTLFASPTVRVPAHDAQNHENAPAYLHTSEHALIQLAFTGCFNSTFYVKAKDQLESAKKLAADVSPRRLAQIAIAGRRHGYMKDAPAFLLALLYQRDTKLFAAAFPQVITNVKMLRTYTQIALSGQAGKMVNLASGVHRRMYQQFFNRISPYDVFNGDVGDKPSLPNLIRLAHVRPDTRQKEAVFQYIFNREFKWKHTKGKTFGAVYEDLPEAIRDFDAFKSGHEYGEYNYPHGTDYRLLEGIVKTPEAWADVFRYASFYVTFKNLATAVRHGVFDVPGMQEVIIAKLQDRESILSSKVFPYQIFTAYLRNKEIGGLPHRVNEALQDALDISLDKVPSLGKVYVACDVSESMKHPYTGNQDEASMVNVRGAFIPSWAANMRRTVSSKTRCVDVAALIASAILRTNRDAEIVPFNGNCIPTHLNSRDSVVTNAEKLASLCRGGTNCSHPLLQANDRNLEFDTFVLISDNESWIDSKVSWNPQQGTRLHAAWQTTKKRLPNARMVNIDLTPNATTQVKERQDILQVGGFSDSVFDVMAAFRRGGNSSDFWAKELDKIQM